MSAPLDSIDTGALWRALLSMQRFAWEQGVASHAAIDAGDLDLARLLARDAVTRADADGQLGGMDDAGAVNSGALLEAALLLGRDDPAAAAAAQRQRWWLLRFSPRDDWGVLHHLRGSTEVWADSVYMVVPALVASGDLAPADMQYRMHREQLWDRASGLYRHRFDMASRAFTRDAFWASGNGWVAAGLARALHLGVDADTVRERWERETRELIDACAAVASPDGRFHDVLDDPKTFTDGCAGLMLAYAAFTGVADGWLPAEYAEPGERWAAAALTRVDDAALVRDVCGAPSFDAPGTSAEAQAFALLTLSARARAA
ncbi:glycoside hydrolase family 88 protein [Demequina lignilytica]|uniref:Glycoside hydrolase family 88 protein n=1 Tax=Demequina lignilytica TaxID=3051663 RepID=A0AB35ML18_9MICO|nr:glycoside hydrolase family 88 protein [Demequina sp. SYSU T0a273]MDN4484368.1 glycoside hydrolase family 88 protein [Demequina sp. SYSU T0a273]